MVSAAIASAFDAHNYDLSMKIGERVILPLVRDAHPDTLIVDRVVPVGIMPADIDGPHNVTMSPDQKSYYVSVAHGAPHGTRREYFRSSRSYSRR